MAGPIATLAVRLSAQISEFQKSFQDGVKSVDDFKSSFEKRAADIQRTVDGIGKTFENFGSVIGTVTVAVAGVTAGAAAFKAAFDLVRGGVESVIGSIKGAVERTADLGDSLFALSQKTSLSVESLSGFKFVAQQTNTSLEAITGAVFKMEANLGEGSKKTAEGLKAIGLSLSDLRKEDPSQAFTDIISKLGELPNASQRAAAGVAIFGKSFKEIAQLSQENLPELIKQANELGVVMSTKTAVAAVRFNDALGAIKAATDGLSQQLGAKLLPAAVAFAEVFGGIFIDAVKQVTGSTKNLGEGFDAFVVQVGQAAARFIEILALMADATAKWVADSAKRLVEEGNAFLNLAPTLITVGRAFDLALGGGANQAAFTKLEQNIESARSVILNLGKGAEAVGATLRGFAQSVAAAANNAGQNFGATFKRIQDEIAASAQQMQNSLKQGGGGGISDAVDKTFDGFTKQLQKLTAEIDRAAKNGTPLSQMVKLFGDEASKAAEKAHAWGIDVKDSVEAVARAFDRADLAKEMRFVGEAIDKVQDKIQKFQTNEMERELKELAKVAQTSIDSVSGRLEKFFEQQEQISKRIDEQIATLDIPLSVAGFGFGLGGVGFTPRQIQQFGVFGQAGAKEASQPFRDAFTKLGDDLPGIILGALQGGGSVFASVAHGVATAFADSFKSAFKTALDQVNGDFSKLSTKSKALGVAAVGIQSFTTGFEIGSAVGSKGKGTAAGAAAGAAAGIPLAGVTGGLSIAVGAGIGALGGFFGGRSVEKKAKEALEQNKIALAQQFGGMEKLRALAEKLGVNIQAAFDAKKPAQFQAAVDKLNAAIDLQNKRVEGLNSALEGVNARAETFAKQFAGLVATKQGGGDAGAAAAQKIQELAQRTQPEFERLGLFVRDAFAGIVKETGNAFQALTDLAPAFGVLKSGITDFGLTSTSVIDGLVDSFDLVNNDTFRPFFENINTTGQLMKGLFDAKALGADTFQAAAADIGQSIQEIVNRGGDISKTLALSQPVLQSLFEAQQRFGGVTDQTTRSILEQAQAQDIVGAQFKSTQDKVLDVLLAINKVLGGDIPESVKTAGQAVESSLGGAFDRSAISLETKVGRSLAGLGNKAKTAASDIENALAGIDVPDIKIGVDLDASAIDRLTTDSRFQSGFDVPALATGGIVRKRTLALVGERGPEAVIPLNRLQSAIPAQRRQPTVAQFGDVNIYGPLDSRERAEQVVKDFARAVRLGGDARTLALRTLGLERV